MKRLDYLFGLSVVFITATACAAPTDVPRRHWAASSVQSITGKKIMGALPDGKFHGNKPVTRYELAVTLDRFVHYIEAGRKPLSSTPQSAVGVKNASPAVKHLLADGFLPPASPLIKGTGRELVTAQQLADALSQVTMRLSDRNLPPNKD